MNITLNVTNPDLQKKILSLLLGNQPSKLYDFSHPESLKDLSPKLCELLLYLSEGPKTQNALKEDFGESYFAYFSHVSRRVNSVLKKYDTTKDWWEFENDMYGISEEASANIKKGIAIQKSTV